MGGLGGQVVVSPSHPLSLAAPQSNKVPVVQHAHPMHPLTPLITYSNERFAPGSPPGHLPPDIDPKTGEGGVGGKVVLGVWGVGRVLCWAWDWGGIGLGVGWALGGTVGGRGMGG